MHVRDPKIVFGAEAYGESDAVDQITKSATSQACHNRAMDVMMITGL